MRFWLFLFSQDSSDKGGREMPVITIQVLKGSLDKECINEMAKRVSEVVAEIECRPSPKENLLPFTYCIVEEVDSEHFIANGEPLTPEVLQAARTGKLHLTVEQA